MKQRGGVPVAAPPEVIFGLLERDRTDFKNDELSTSERIGDVPFGPGYQFKTTAFHNGHMCVTTTRVTVCEAPLILHEEWVHDCRALGKLVTGTERFEIIPDPKGTILVGHLVQRTPGLAGVFEPLIGSLCNVAKAKVRHLGMRAEAVVAAVRDHSFAP